MFSMNSFKKSDIKGVEKAEKYKNQDYCETSEKLSSI